MNNGLKNIYDGLVYGLNKTAKSFLAFKNFKKTYHSSRRWRMMNKNGQNKKERSRSQVKLKGRGCRERHGMAPTRGPGRRHKH